MSEVTLEKIDVIRERIGASYSEAKDALEACDGNVVEAIILLEKNHKSKMEEIYTTKDELFGWIKENIKKGNVTRIKIKKEDKVIVDIPVNAGIMAGLVALIWPPLIAIGVLTAVFTKITIEITRSDGTVEVVNKIIKNTVEDVKEKVSDLACDVKEKFTGSSSNENIETDNVYKYTVKFENIENSDEQKQ